MSRLPRWASTFGLLSVGLIVGYWVASSRGSAPKPAESASTTAPAASASREHVPSRGELLLADFETPSELTKRWELKRVTAVQADEHATHGRFAAKVTFEGTGKGSPAFLMEESLSRDRALSDWRGYAALSFDIYNAEEKPRRLFLQVKDQAGHRYKQKFKVKGKTATHMTIPLQDVKSAVDLGQVAQLNFFQFKPEGASTFYFDAIRLQAVSDAAGEALGPGASAEAPEIVVASSAVTPDRLGGLLFTRTAHQPVVRVPVTLVGPDVPLSVGFNISGGIPFAMGQLKADGAVRLHDAGDAVWPVQTRPLATWEDGSVKWLLVTAQVPPNARGRQLWMEYGSPVSADPLPVARVRVEDTPDLVTVTTGPLRLTVSKQRFTLFESAAVDVNGNGTFEDAEQLAGGGDLVVKHRNTEFRSSRDAQTYTLTVEEAGPLRATLKASGWFRDPKGNGFCQFTVRLQAFAGLPQVRVYHTFVYTGYPANLYHAEYKEIKLPENETIQDIRLELPIRTAMGARVITADEQGTVTWPLNAQLTISQLAHNAYHIRQGTSSLREGAHHEGWMLVQDAYAGVMVGVRDAWQQYPKELVADPAAGRVIIKLWPESAGPLNLETGPESYGPDDVARGSAFGLGKTHELMFGFLGQAIEPPIAQALAHLWEGPWLLTADPQWLLATDVLGTVGPGRTERVPNAEPLLGALFGWAERQPRDFAWYGMLDYGDTRTWYRKQSGEWGWYPVGRWGWHNCEAVGSHGGALLSFMRTLDPRYFAFGEAKTRHVLDVDTVHYNTVANDARLSTKIPDTFAKVGSMHRHSAYHWGGRNDEADHTNVTGILLYYYLTGYERAWDVAQEVGEFFLQDIITYTKHPDIAPSRAIGNILWGDVLLYEATKDDRYRKGADRWVNVLLKGQRRDGAWLETYNPTTEGWTGDLEATYMAHHILPGLIAYHRLTGHEAVARAIVKATDALIANEKYYPFFDSLAYSYLLTGEKKYLDEGLHRVKVLVKAQSHTGDPTMDGMVFEKAYYDRVGPTLYSVPFLLGALDAPDFITLQNTLRQETGDRRHVPRPMSPVSNDAVPQATPYEVLVMPSTEKVLPEVGTLKGSHKNPAVVSLARNEYEAVQLILRSAQSLQQVTVEPSDLKQVNGDGVIPRDAITWSPVGFVKTKQPSYDVEHVGFWPDPLPAASAFEVKPDWPQPIWLTIYAAPGTPAGGYAGTVTIRPANAPAQVVEVKATVWEFELPTTPALKTAFDVYVNRIKSGYKQFFPQWWQAWAARVGGIEQLEQRLYEDLIRHRLAPVLNIEISGPQAARYLQQLRELGLSAFAIGRYSGSFGNNWPKEPEQLGALIPLYRSYASALRNANLLDRHYIYTFDEPKPDSPRVTAITRMVHEADPALKNLVVLEDTPNPQASRDWLQDIDILCLRNVTFDPVQADALKQMGKELWLYVSGPSTPYPTLVIDYPAMAYRILPWMCWKYGLNGLLYWSVNYWTTNPYEEPMNTKWQQNGNGSLYYPGPDGPVPSLRLEVLRDGMEDYEYLHRLAEVTAKAKADGSQPATLIQQAEALLAVDSSLVESMGTYSKDPTVLARNRTAIAELIEQLQ